jgi:iron complex outermembrane receptor protein
MKVQVLCYNIVAFLLLLPLQAQSQTGILAGTITDAETNSAIPNARAVVSSLKRGAVANAAGEFRIENLPAATYTITISSLGFRSHTERVVIADGKTTAVNVRLASDPLETEQVIVTASRKPERILNAPASVSVVDAAQIVARTPLSPVENIRGLPSVDIVSTGLQQNIVVVRGFNSALSGRMLTMVDNRIVNLPSLRSNLFQTISVSNEDIERIEVVAGPASAMYGPNSAGGVMHTLTKSPLEHQGTTVSLAGGERSLMLGSFSHSALFTESFGFRLSGQFMRGNDWEYFDPAEPDTIIRAVPTPYGRVVKSGPISNKRDFRLKRQGLDARLDYRWSDDLTSVLSGGVAQVSDIELSGVGAIQVADGVNSYAQLRTTYKNLFVQMYLTSVNTGDSYFLRTGDFQAEHSLMYVGQAQHSFELANGRHRFVYGADALLTRPSSDYTLYGRNEDSDDINELGYFGQYETDLTEQFKLVLAARYDSHSQFKSGNWSPRAALVYKPTEVGSFRLTYNQSYESPMALDLFADFVAADQSRFQGLPYNARLRGVPKTGFHFKRPDGLGKGLGGWYMRTPFAPALGYQDAEATWTWPAVVPFLQSRGLDVSGLANLQPSPAVVGTSLRTLNLNTLAFDPVQPSDIKDIDPIDLSRTTTIEFGYQGLLSDRLLFKATLYRENTVNPLGAYIVQTPNVFYDYATLNAYLVSQNVSPGRADTLAKLISSIPLGTIAPIETDSTDLMVTTRSFGDVTFWGGDVSLAYALSREWSFSGSYTYVSENFFGKSLGDYDDITLNAPRHKGSFAVAYESSGLSLSAETRLRYVGEFFVISGIGRETIPSYTIVDVNASYKLPFDRHITAYCSIQNLLDYRHKEYVGVPVLGRIGVLRIGYSF